MSKRTLEASESILMSAAVAALCDTSPDFFEGKYVAVLGGGDTAMGVYAQLIRQSPAQVLIFTGKLVASAAAVARADELAILGMEYGYDVFPYQGPGRSHLITVRDDPFSRYGFDYLIVAEG